MASAILLNDMSGIIQYGDIANMFTEKQQDALKEVINVGMSKSAKVLSKLLHQKVHMSIPKIRLLHLADISEEELFQDISNVSYVYQSLRGGLKGGVFLIYDERHAKTFLKPVLDKAFTFDELNINLTEQEGMLEVGNIMVSALLSGIVNMLKTQVDIGVPLYGNCSVMLLSNHLLKKSALANNGDSTIFVFQVMLETTVDKQNLSIDIILSMESIDQIISSINTLLES